MRRIAFLPNLFSARKKPARAAQAEAPIRAEYYRDEALAAAVKKLAAGISGELPFFTPFRFSSRLSDSAQKILHAFHASDAAARRHETISPATQWLIDNYYTIDKAIKQIRLSFRPKLARRLPPCPQQKSVPRIFALAWFYVAHTDSSFSLDGFTKTVRAYQEVEKLTIGELWLLPAALRFVLVENARRIAGAIEHDAAMRSLANQAADKIITFHNNSHQQNLDSFLARYTANIGDAAFSAPLLSRLENASADTATSLKWLHYKIAAAAGDGSGDAPGAESSRQAQNGVTMGNIIRAFKAIDDIEWAIWFESVCSVDFILRDSSDFSALDPASRNAYRSAVEAIAKGSRRSETEVAEKAVALAQKGGAARGRKGKRSESEQSAVSAYLLGKKRPMLEQACGYRAPLSEKLSRQAAKLKIGGIALPVAALTVLFVLLVYTLCRHGAGLTHGAAALLSLAALLPAADMSFALFNTLVSWFMPPRQLVGYAFAGGPPEEAKTLVAVPILIGSKENVDEQLRNLEVHYLSNPHGAVHFALLSDWKDSQEEASAADLALLDYARAQTRTLNNRYPRGELGQAPLFFFLHRRQLYNPSENCFMGWERKRGKLHELNRLLRGAADTSFYPPDAALPANIRYVMTLDSDTRLTSGSVAKLAGKMSHPLNRPHLDAKSGTVREGYGLMQPRLVPSLSVGAEASALQRIFSGERGLDPYVFAVSDTYQDILAEGTYTGKGIYDIDAFEASLKGRIRDNTILSHDLLEGGYARTAFAGDVEVVEDYPISYYVDTARRHRWIRGDWQLLPYLFNPAGKKINAATAWKMLDNLRRSLMPAAMIAAFLCGWCLLPFKGAALWSLALTAAVYAAPLLALARAACRFDSDYLLRAHMRAVGLQAGGLLLHMGLYISFLAYSAYYASDAIMRTIYRLFISRKHLLEWQSSDAAKNLPKTGRLKAYFHMMLPGSVLALAVFAIAFFCGGSGFYAGLPFIFLWLLAPLIAWAISRSAAKRDALRLKPADSKALRRAARRDWAFYEAFVNEAGHYLPPDNFQESPDPVLAQRTSPTNIGLYLLSTMAARDFGWIDLRETLDRLEKTLGTLDRLEKFRGHIYNWYQTDTLKPLEPLYISTVDSGNLAGHLVTLAAGLNSWAQNSRADAKISPFRAPKSAVLSGIADHAAILAEALSELPLAAKAAGSKLKALRKWAQTAGSAVTKAALHEQVAKAAAITEALDRFHQTEPSEASLFAARSGQSLLACCRAHEAEYAAAENLAGAAKPAANKERTALARRMEKLAQKARQLAFAMQFGFLEHKSRRLLSIGYRIRENELDEGCYDLLASEARLAVLFAIAKGDIAPEYWGRLGRIMVDVGSKGALLSWSGSMFEYLMPPLVMKEPLGSLLHQTAALTVRRQIEYGAELRLPWGISEAAFNARDPQMNYQYSAFGVPSLGLQRGLSRNRVIAPYATMLAAQFAPAAAAANLKRLEKLGALGPYGYYDSLDFTPSRVPEGSQYATVRNYYAHHHGMAILAAVNAVKNNIMQARFHSDPVIEAVELLLQEKAPREIPVLNAKALNPLRSDTDRAEQNSVRIIEQPLTKPRAAQLLSGGAYTLMLTARGSGVSRWNGMNITRYQADATEDCQGGFLFLRDCRTGRWWSAADEPTRVAGEDMRTVFTAEKAEFFKHIDGIHSAVECLAAAEGDGEGRRIKLYNQTNRDRVLEIISYGELALAPADVDAAHPVFSRMFIETEIADQGQTVFARRRRRESHEQPIHIAHFVSAAEGEILSAQAETDRRAFIGRGRSIRRPAFFDKAERGKAQHEEAAAAAQGAAGFVMDPVYCISIRLKIPAHKKAELVFWTMAAADYAKLKNDIARCRSKDAFEREFTAVWTRSQIIRHQIGLTPQDVSDYQTYAEHLLFPERHWQAPKAIAENLGRQSDLWPMAISGDLPICVLRIDEETDMPVVREMLRAHEYWRACGLTADLVLLNERQFSYAQDTQREIEWLSEGHRARACDAGGKPHIFLLQKDRLSDRSYRTLLAAARIVLYAGNGSLAEQLAHFKAASPRTAYDKQLPAASLGLIAHEDKNKSRRRRQNAANTALSAAAQKQKTAASHKTGAPAADLRYWNGFGGFEQDGSYYIRLRGQQSTPHPWINIISNQHFGMHISAGGAAFSWAGNSRDYQLTPWSNDPVSNRPGEALYIVDMATKHRFSPVSAVECDETAFYETRHGLGWSRFSSEHDAIATDLIYTVDTEQPLRFARLRLSNRGAQARKLRLYNYAEWVLGNNRAKTAPFMIPAYDAKRGALMVSNPYHIDRPEAVSFITASLAPSSFTADRAEFIGAAGTVKHPLAVSKGAKLSGKAEAGGDMCSAMAYDVSLKPGETKDIIFCLGHAENLRAAQHLLDYARSADFSRLLNRQKRYWADFTGGLQVETPDDSFNLLVNHWLPYQTYVCRLKARAAFYQASGAFGLRDQLQDTLALLLLKPALARRQIAAAAGRQFKEGDLQHWWLPETGAGVRTMISDDVVWLAYSAALYAHFTGDTEFLNKEIPFIEGDMLAAGQADSYFQPAVSTEKASLYEHCARALNLALQRMGKNGLPLMLGGDWNDGMNRVGAGGKGESVWLGWFLGKALVDFIPLAAARKDIKNAEYWAEARQKLSQALEKAGWDGKWYRRAYYDDGAPLGSAASDECRIDTIAQSWSIISGLAAPARQKQAFGAMLEQLYDDKAKLLRLFWPPFDKTAHNPGYISAYPPGVRENGGQYTHGALWAIIAAAQLGENETAYRLFSIANPIRHAANAETYRVEPYAVAADIYSVGAKRGMGGWTWYTGSAGWLYRAATEAILGLQKQGAHLLLKPCLPQAWKTVNLRFRHEKALYKIRISQNDASNSLKLNGKTLDYRQGVPLAAEGEHEIVLTLRAKQTAAKAKPSPAAKGKAADKKRETARRKTAAH